MSSYFRVIIECNFNHSKDYKNLLLNFEVCIQYWPPILLVYLVSFPTVLEILKVDFYFYDYFLIYLLLYSLFFLFPSLNLAKSVI